MNSPKVLLATLEERTAASGTRYLSGWLGKARIVGFFDRDAEDGKTVWNIFAQEPQPRGEQDGRSNGNDVRHREDGGARFDRSSTPRHQQTPDVARQAAGDRPF